LANYKVLKNQLSMFDLSGSCVLQEYVEMPEYNNIDEPEPEITCKFKFRNQKDYLKFKELVSKHIYKGQKFIDGNQSMQEKQSWFPLAVRESHHVVFDKNNLKPKFPIYIVSKGRFENNPTRETLLRMNVDFYMIVEKQEKKNYAKYIDPDKLLVLPDKYKNEYDTFWNDSDKRIGPGAARNFAWEHSMQNGFDWHWVMDDNIESFQYFNNNVRAYCLSGACFAVCENFVLRYENIALSGLNYTNFCHRHEGRPPLILNTRIYSCLLINNAIPFRWRGRYNEDTDLSIRALKGGWCTVQFNSFLQGKMSTQKMKGGNTDEFYKKEGTKLKSQMLVDMHPDVASLTKKFNRWHHHVNYKVFKHNKLKRKADFKPKNKINNFGIYVQNVKKHYKKVLQNGK